MARTGYYAEAGLSGGPQMLGMSAAAGSLAAGEALPPTTGGAGGDTDHPLSPDSSMFWLIAFTLAAVFGVAGASVQARARVFRGRGAVGAELGET